MINLTIHRVILHTKSMTPEKIAALGGDNATPEDNALYQKIYQTMDGQEAIVMPRIYDSNKMTFCCLTDPEGDRELSYLMEQDPWLGCYIDDREAFDREYDSGDYGRDVNFILDADLVSIIETIEAKPNMPEAANEIP